MTIAGYLNDQTGDYSHTITGSGSYDKNRTDGIFPIPTVTTLTTTSGSTGFTVSEQGNDIAGEIVLDHSGTNRYDLLQAFSYNSDGATSKTGVLTFSPVGTPFGMIPIAPGPSGQIKSVGDDRFRYCFARGTLVLMADGSSKPIETIKAGEMVLSVDEHDLEGKAKPQKVVEAYRNPPGRLIELHFAQPRSLHPWQA